MFSISNIIDSVFFVIVLTFSVIMHEVCHGYAAYLLGDNTAKYQKRLSFNPFDHINYKSAGLIVAGILVSYLLPVLKFLSNTLMFIGFFMIAKPVPINPNYFEDPKKGMAITALMGPLSNFVFAFIAIFVFVALPDSRFMWDEYIFMLLFNIIFINVRLAVFNLIPIPPLDGSKVLYAFLPQRIYFYILQYERYILIGLMLLVFSGGFSAVINNGSNNVIKAMETAVRAILGKGGF